MSGTKRQQGFSLVEIVAALAIISVALVSIINLISISLQSSQNSRDDTDIAVMSQTVIALLRTNGYTNTMTVTGSTAGSGNYLTFYFDASGAISHDKTGNVVSGSNGTSGNIANAYPSAPVYACNITNRTPASANFPANFVLPANFAYLRLDFAWPYAAPAANQTHKYVYTSLTPYN